MKTFSLAAILSLFWSIYLPAQSDLQLLKILTVIQEVENEYLKGNPNSSSWFNITTYGFITEKDTIDDFEISFNLSEIQESEIRAVYTDEPVGHALTFYCKKAANCIKVVANGKTRYHSSFEAYYTLFEQPGQLDQTISNFKQLNSLLTIKK